MTYAPKLQLGNAYFTGRTGAQMLCQVLSNSSPYGISLHMLVEVYAEPVEGLLPDNCSLNANLLKM